MADTRRRDYDSAEEGSDYGDGREDPPEVVAARQLNCINMLLILFGGGMCAFGYYVSVSGWTGVFMAYIVAAIGFMVFLMACLGLCGALASHHKTLLLYYTCLLFATMATLVAGGFCFILNEQAQTVLAEEWEEISANAGIDESSEDAEQQLETNLYITGGAAFLVMFLLLCAMGSVTGIVDKAQAYSLLMQASNMTVLPLGFLMVAGAVFIADTAASADAPTTAFGIFAMGAFVIGLSLLGCIGVSISARGLIKLFIVLVFFISLLFFAFGIVAFVQAETLKEKITDNWTTIRRVLPPTFSGKYDQEQFTNFLEANLNAAGFISLCMGVLLMSQVWAGTKLRSAIKEAHEREDEEFAQGGGNVAPRAFTDKPRDSGVCCNLKRCWTRNWRQGTKKSRCYVICGCSCLCFFLLLIVAVCTAALYFSTSCASLSDFSVTATHEPAAGANIKTGLLYNNYTRGANNIEVDAATSSMYFKFEKSALRESLANEQTGRVETVGTSFQMTGSPKAETEIMGFDVSCQQATMTAFVAPVIPNVGDTLAASQNGLTMRLESAGFTSAEAVLDLSAPRFKKIVFVTEHGPATLEGVKLGDSGARIVTDSGEIYIKDSNCIGNPKYVGDDSIGGVHLTTTLGGVIVEDTTFFDTELIIKGGASLIRVTGVTSSTTRGIGALIQAEGEKGLIEIIASTADEYSLTGTDGSVKCNDITVRDTLKASSVKGNVILSGVNVKLRASVQVETTSGAITIKLAKFAGFVSLHSSGRITIKNKDEAQWSDVSETTVDNFNTATANVNCATIGNCPYLGELLVISKTGGITVTVDAWDQGAAARRRLVDSMQNDSLEY